ncbi:MAG: enoyl-CoA hydratase-related protein [Deltaproteobacteria bacterium]|nr:enoyl-CoA hydratase-related protein [Deltaproteobacteria bacterium]
MPHVGVRVEGGVAAVVLSRGKVNALDEATIDELNDRFREIEEDEAVRAVTVNGENMLSYSGYFLRKKGK